MTEDQFPVRQSSYYYTLEYQRNVSRTCYSKLQIEIVLFCYVQTTELDYKNTNSKTEVSTSNRSLPIGFCRHLLMESVVCQTMIMHENDFLVNLCVYFVDVDNCIHALTLLVGQQKGIQPVEKPTVGTWYAGNVDLNGVRCK